MNMKRFRSLTDSLFAQFALVELALLTAFFLRFDFALPRAMKLPLLWAVLRGRSSKYRLAAFADCICACGATSRRPISAV